MLMIMAVQMIFLLLLSIVNAMQLDMSKVKSDSSLSVTVIQERLLDSWTLKLDKRDTLIRLYSLVSAVSHFDDTQFSLYLDERCLVASTCTVESAGINDMDVLLLKVIPSSPLEPTEQQSPEYPLGKVASADTILFSPRLRRSNPNLRMKSKSAGGEYCRTPRKRVNQSRVECFYLLPAEQQGMIREAFYEDIIRNEKLTIILENKYRELIETMFTDLPKFNEMLSPELMLEIDEIEDKLRASGQFIEMGEQALEVSNDDEEESEDFVSQVLHVMAMVNGHPIPVLLDCMVTEASSTKICAQGSLY